MKNYKLILIAVALVMIPAMMATWGVTETSEARYAQISREMFTSGDHLHPTLLGIQHYHKPPVTYYITSLGYSIFGVNETGGRFFLAVALLIQLLLVYKITAKLYNNEKMALAAALIYFSYPLAQAAAKNLTTDLYLTTFIFAGIYTFIQYRQKQQVGFLYLFYIFCGLAFLTKGPVGLMPQGLFAIFYSRLQRKDKKTGVHAFIAPFIGIIICASWFLLLVVNNPAFLDYFIKYQLVDRVASDTFSRSKPFWYYLLMMPLLTLPAFIYFADYLRSLFVAKRQPDPVARGIFFSFLISLLVFSLSSSKLVFYVLPLYLFMAILSAKHLAGITDKNRTILEKTAFIFSCILFCAMMAACFVSIEFIIPLIPVWLFCGAGLIVSFIVFFNKNITLLKGPLLNAIFIVAITLVMPFIMKQNEAAINSVKPLATFLQNQSGGKPGTTVMVYNQLLPSLNFYTSKKIITIYNGNY
ncbi:MAG: glycosyltransferase family 39 protein, partial [Ferruginibacter sp.]|nr:glycosyltransferase family 39 protein [Ferruginibacter sp.]